MQRFISLLGAGLLALLPTLGAAQEEPARVQDGRLVDAEGLTLYTYGKDKEGESNCHEECANIWPPLIAAEDARPSGKWSLVKAATARCNGPMTASRCTPTPRTNSPATPPGTASVPGRWPSPDDYLSR